MASDADDLNSEQGNVNFKCLAFAYEFMIHIRTQLNLPSVSFFLTRNMQAVDLVFIKEKEFLEKYYPIVASKFYESVVRRVRVMNAPFSKELFDSIVENIKKDYSGKANLAQLCAAIACLGIYADVKGFKLGLSKATFFIQDAIFQELQKSANINDIGVKEICKILNISKFH